MTNVVIIERVEIRLDTKTAARWFANLTSDEMGDFLINVAEEVKKYPSSPDNQWYYNEVRDMIKSWAYWIEHSKHR